MLCARSVDVFRPGGMVGASGQGASRINGGLGSGEENTGDFLNLIGENFKILRFDLTSVTGLAANETIDSIVLENILSQNGTSTAADQGGGFGGTFGNLSGDSFFIGSSGTRWSSCDDSPTSIVRPNRHQPLNITPTCDFAGRIFLQVGQCLRACLPTRRG